MDKEKIRLHRHTKSLCNVHNKCSTDTKIVTCDVPTETLYTLSQSPSCEARNEEDVLESTRDADCLQGTAVLVIIIVIVILLPVQIAEIGKKGGRVTQVTT
jgi:hypothetical protein